MPKTIRSLRLADRTWRQLEIMAEFLMIGDRTKVVEEMTEKGFERMVDILNRKQIDLTKILDKRYPGDVDLPLPGVDPDVDEWRQVVDLNEQAATIEMARLEWGDDLAKLALKSSIRPGSISQRQMSEMIKAEERRNE